MSEFDFRSLGTNFAGIHKQMKTETDGSITVVKSQDMKAMIEEIKQIKDGQMKNGYTPSKDIQSVAIVPTLLLMKWIEEEGGNASYIHMDDARYNDLLNKNLNNPDYADFRTGSGRVNIHSNIRMI